MPEILTISKNQPASKASDFQFLTDKALRYVQLVAGNNWTDFNTHDPGRTILEQLAYAINDLSYRTSQPMEDLLAEDNGASGEQTHFFTPREILSCNPVNINDFRKILIDLPGIKNAWLAPRVEDDFYSDGPAVYYDKANTQLKYAETPAELENDQALRITGLYDILLEFESHEAYGELNGNSIYRTLEVNKASSQLHGLKVVIAAQFPYWDDSLFPDTDLSRFDPVYEKAMVKTLANHLQEADITIYNDLEPYSIQFGFNNESKTLTASVTERATRSQEPELEEELNKLLAQAKELLAKDYLQRVNHIKGLINEVNEQLYQHRNLCEDFINVKSVKVKELAICIKVDLEHQAHPNEVLANIFFQIEQFLSPALKWSSLEELMTRKVPLDEIFEGPALNNGFLTDDQMEVSDRRRMIYVSDLINIISDITGVKFLSEIELGLKKNGLFEDNHEGEQWHLELAEENESLDYFIPRLNIDNSNVRFFKDRIPLSTNRDKVNEHLEALRNDKPILEKPIKLDLPLPKGSSQEVGEYISIQDHFPTTYQIGELGPSPVIDLARKGQIKQLKAYLLVFEQLLANYLAQLANINQLFSINTSISQTYFSQGLFSVPDVDNLLLNFLTQNGSRANSRKSDEELKKENWEVFLEELRRITEGRRGNGSEDQTTFTDRRNRFLDHLMARFHEQVDDYANIMHSIDADTSGTQLIEDKASLLQDYPIISSQRGKAFDLLSDSNNSSPQLSGLEKRMARLLGIDMHNLSGVGASFETYEDAEGQYRFRLRDQTGEIILNSADGYPFEEDMKGLKAIVFEAAKESKNYQKKIDRRGRYYINLLGPEGKVIARSQEYHEDQLARVDEILNVTDSLRKMDEKLHVLEHLLLRPKIKDLDKLLPVNQSNSPDQEPCGPCHYTPYSFNISVVLPSWPKRFRNLDFRRYVEEKIRLETPAHVYARICWVGHAHMAVFEQKLDAWKKALARVDFNDDLFLAQMNGMPFMTYVEDQLTQSYQALNDEAPDPIKVNRTHIKKQVRILRRKATQKRLSLDFRFGLLSLIDRLEKCEVLLNRSICHNALIDAMALLRTDYPEATLYDCEESNAENPIALGRTILGTFKPLEENE